MVDREMSEPSHASGYERTDANPRLLIAIASGFVLFLAASPLIVLGIFPGSDSRGGIERNRQMPPAPRLQVAPRADLAALRSAETRQLNSYGWIDRDRGIAHIPIHRAMELLVQRGLPDWPSANPPSN
jgi:hypothetical protein